MSIHSSELEIAGAYKKAKKAIFRISFAQVRLDQNRDRLPSQINDQLGELMRISKNLRRDRELAFYGSEDLTPSEFYTGDDAAAALAQARQVYLAVNNVVRLANGKDNRS